nr:hypothetical protein [Escherichia fergusonii]
MVAANADPTRVTADE